MDSSKPRSRLRYSLSVLTNRESYRIKSKSSKSSSLMPKSVSSENIKEDIISEENDLKLLMNVVRKSNSFLKRTNILPQKVNAKKTFNLPQTESLRSFRNKVNYCQPNLDNFNKENITIVHPSQVKMPPKHPRSAKPNSSQDIFKTQDLTSVLKEINENKKLRNNVHDHICKPNNLSSPYDDASPSSQVPFEVHSLSSEIASLSPEVNSLLPVVPSLSPEEPSLSPEEPSLSPKVPSLSPEVPSLSPEVPSLSPKGPTLSPEVPSMSPEVPSMSPEVPSLSPEVPSLSPKVPSLSPEVPSLSPEVPSLSPEVPSLSPEVPSMSSEVPSLSPELPSLSPDDPSLSSEVILQSPEIPSPSPEVPPLSAKVPPLSPEVPPLSPEVPPMSPEIPPLSPEVPPLSPEVPPLSPEIPFLTPEVASISPEVLSLTETSPKDAFPFKFPDVDQFDLSSSFPDDEIDNATQIAGNPSQKISTNTNSTSTKYTINATDQINKVKNVNQVANIDIEISTAGNNKVENVTEVLCQEKNHSHSSENPMDTITDMTAFIFTNILNQEFYKIANSKTAIEAVQIQNKNKEEDTSKHEKLWSKNVMPSISAKLTVPKKRNFYDLVTPRGYRPKTDNGEVSNLRWRKVSQ